MEGLPEAKQVWLVALPCEMLLVVPSPQKFVNVHSVLLTRSSHLRFSVPSRSRFHRSGIAEKRGQKDGVDYGEYNERKKQKLREGQGNGTDSVHETSTVPTKSPHLSRPRQIVLHHFSCPTHCLILLETFLVAESVTRHSSAWPSSGWNLFRGLHLDRWIDQGLGQGVAQDRTGSHQQQDTL
jgi:hypothetical protein